MLQSVNLGLVKFVLFSIVLVFHPAQDEREERAAKQLVMADGFVLRDEMGRIHCIAIRPRRAKDLRDIDFGAFKNVNMVKVNLDQCTDELLVQLQALPSRLEFLGFDRAAVTEKGLAAFVRKNKSIKDLTISNIAITDKLIPELQELKELRVLSLVNTKITDKGLKALSKLPVRYLNLAGNDISDAGLREIGRMQRLEFLSLEGTKVTDLGLQELHKLSNLTSLGLESTNVTEDGKRGLKTALPRLNFYKTALKIENK